MSIARYDLTEDCTTGKVDITPVPETMEGRYVSYEDYAALEQKLAESQREFRAADATIENMQMQLEKMAAENAGLKKFITQECHVAHVEPETFYEEEITRYVNADGYEPETPATDAFLAEVRMQGVEMLAEHLSGMNISASETSVREFAAQLRKGVQS